jgi:hypothetical protein
MSLALALGILWFSATFLIHFLKIIETKSLLSGEILQISISFIIHALKPGGLSLFIHKVTLYSKVFMSSLRSVHYAENKFYLHKEGVSNY